MSTDDTTTRDRSCEDRIEAAQRGRLDDIAALLAIIEADDDPDTLAALPLSTWRNVYALGVFDVPDAILPLLTPGADYAASAEDAHDATGDTRSGSSHEALADLLRNTGNPPGVDIAEAASEALHDYGLSVDVERTIVVRWVFGTGGPHDEVEMTMERDAHSWTVDSAAFVFKDWFDGARSPLTDDDLATVTRAADHIGITEPGVVISDDDRADYL